MHYFRVLITAATIGLSSLAAHADTFTYDFTSTDNNSSFQFTDATQLSNGTYTITSSTPGVTGFSCTTGGDACSITIDISGNHSSIELNYISHNHKEDTDFDSLPANDLTTIGKNTYDPNRSQDPFTLTITDNSGHSQSPSPVPEPSTLAMLGTGLVGAAGAFRRRLAVR